MAGDLRRCGARAQLTGPRAQLGSHPGAGPPGEMSGISCRYDAVSPDEAPAGLAPEPPPWLMASTGRTSPGWSRPLTAASCQDVPGRSRNERLLRGGHLAGHGPARLGDQYL